MAVTLVPYQYGMQLGQGYNTFSQEVRINDAVQKLGGKLASEKDLHLLMETQDTYHRQPSNDEDFLRIPSGTFQRQTKHGNIHQSIKWEARFVQSIGDVVQRSGLSAAKVIKLDSTGAKVKSQGYFLDEVAFKAADLNYLIHVEVINQKWIGTDVSQFTPIRSVPPARFTEVYGDAFISGFVEGGIFSALISINLNGDASPSTVDNVTPSSSSLGQNLNDLIGNSPLHLQSTSISVSWAGGGAVRPDGVTEWTMDTLRDAAMTFPDVVAACPERVSAIATKYTSLRSFQEQVQRGSPLSYDAAGLYAHSLLDAYTEYKALVSNIHGQIDQLGCGNIVIVQQPIKSEMIEYSHLLEKENKSYQSLLADRKKPLSMTTYTPNVTALLSNSASTITDDGPYHPLDPTPYPATILGLQRAQRDVYTEMTKIAREIDLISTSPQIRNDTKRPEPFMRPAVFKMLLPLTERVQRKDQKTEREDFDMALQVSLKNVQEELESKKLANVALEARVSEIKSQLDLAQKSLEESTRMSDNIATLKEQLKASLTNESNPNSLQNDISRLTAEATRLKGIEDEKKLLVESLKTADARIKSATEAKALLEASKNDLQTKNEGLERKLGNAADILRLTQSQAPQQTQIREAIASFWSAQSPAQGIPSTGIQVEINSAMYGGVDCKTKVREVLAAFNPSSSEKFVLNVDAASLGLQPDAPKDKKFQMQINIRRKNVLDSQSVVINREDQAKLELDFYETAFFPYPDIKLSQESQNTVHQNRLKGADYSLSRTVGALPENNLTMLFVPALEPGIIIRRLVFCIVDSSPTDQKGALAGITVYSLPNHNEQPEHVGKTATDLSGRLPKEYDFPLKENEHIIAAELRQGLMAGFGNGTSIGCTAATFWTSIGREFSFDYYPPSPNTPDKREVLFITPPNPGYVLKGFWAGQGEIIDRLGLVWGQLNPGVDLEAKAFCENYETLSAPWKAFVEKNKGLNKDLRMSSVFGLQTADALSHNFDDLKTAVHDSANAGSHPSKLTMLWKPKELSALKLEYNTGIAAAQMGPILTTDEPKEMTFANQDQYPRSFVIDCVKWSANNDNLTLLRIQIVDGLGTTTLFQGKDVSPIKTIYSSQQITVTVSAAPGPNWDWKGFVVQISGDVVMSMAIIWVRVS